MVRENVARVIKVGGDVTCCECGKIGKACWVHFSGESKVQVCPGDGDDHNICLTCCKEAGLIW